MTAAEWNADTAKKTNRAQIESEAARSTYTQDFALSRRRRKERRNGKPATIVVRVGNNRPDLGTNPICNRFTGTLEEGQPLFLPCNPPMPGAFVSVHLETSAPSQLSICEAFVYTDQALPIERCPAFRDMPPGASASYNGKCYIFYSRQPATLRDALAFCRSRGGTLINESNPALQGFISWELWRRHRSDTSSQYWMGAVRDTQDRNTWKWIGGDEVAVSFWNLPGGDEDCARYDGSKGWLWSDTNCNTQLNFICQHQPKACGRPEQPPNSTMVAPKGFDVGAVVEYNCDEGHLLVGPPQRTCLETGFYNEFPPVCKCKVLRFGEGVSRRLIDGVFLVTDIECGLPASIPNGFYDLVNGSVGYLSSVHYKCAEGYEMVGRALLTCDIDERWNGPPPRCELIDCEPLPTLFPNGAIVAQNGTVFGAKAEVVCNAGFIPDGSETEIFCTATGQWSNVLAKCVEDPAARVPSTTTAAPTTRPSSIMIVSTTPVPATQYTQKRPQSRRPPTRPQTTRLTTSSSTTQSPLFSIEIDDGNESDGLDGFYIGTNEDYSLPPLEVRPGLVREDVPPPPRKPYRPGQNTIAKIPSVQQVPPNRVKPPAYYEPPTQTTTTTSTTTTTTTQTPPQTRPTTTSTRKTTTSRSPQDIILSQHPQDNEIAGSVNIRQDQSPKVNVPFAVDNSDSDGTNGGGIYGGIGGNSNLGSGSGERKESKNARLNLGAIVALGAFGGFVFLAAVITTIVIVVRR
ncbi:furrowed [Culex quinquefasciatus]|uniref:Furrowed n=1 Tax=Culex quinquefasciatus TaxID=7176 RepID=B0XHT7_CULQU|nr:furrowed [Culex quinquefasciatus]|eukprot:XP_001869209.1 furrowed [Culex quinquefasciatus]